MILYHGTDTYIDRIDLNACKPFKDFGKGFYLSSDYDQAMELAKARAEASGRNPIVHSYEFDEAILYSSELSIKLFDSYSEEWARFVLENREGICHKHYDIVYGPIANDKVGAQIRLYREKFITLKEFMSRLKYMKGLTFQYYFGTERAIEKLLRK